MCSKNSCRDSNLISAMPAHHMVSGEYQKSTLVKGSWFVEWSWLFRFTLSVRMQWHLLRLLGLLRLVGRTWNTSQHFENQHGGTLPQHGVGKSPPRNGKYFTRRFCSAGAADTGTPLMPPSFQAPSISHVPAFRWLAGIGCGG